MIKKQDYIFIKGVYGWFIFLFFFFNKKSIIKLVLTFIKVLKRLSKLDYKLIGVLGRGMFIRRMLRIFTNGVVYSFRKRSRKKVTNRYGISGLKLLRRYRKNMSKKKIKKINIKKKKKSIYSTNYFEE